MEALYSILQDITEITREVAEYERCNQVPELYTVEKWRVYLDRIRVSLRDALTGGDAGS